MNRQCHLVIATALSALSFAALARGTPGPKLASSGLPAMSPQSARVAAGLTLFEQDSKNADLAVTARIRGEISIAKNLSVKAKNVNIVTKSGRVVLEGFVNTAAEKRLIGDIAIRVQRRENVDNQLEIRLAPSAPTSLRVVQ